MNDMEGLGTHLLAELFDCDRSQIDNIKTVEKVMLAAAEISRATVIEPFFHKFSPYGISGVVVIAESHITIHTWPENNYAAVDIFTCGDLDSHAGIEHIKEELGAGKCVIYKMRRGIDHDNISGKTKPGIIEVDKAGLMD